MRKEYPAFLERLRAALLAPKARLPLPTRTDIVEGRIVEAPLNGFVIRVRANASTIRDSHIDALRSAGFDEDQIFEATVCAAYRAGLERYEAAMAAMKATESDDAT